MTNLVGRTRQEIASLLEPHIDRDFRSDQVAHWIIVRGARSFDDMGNLPKTLRRELGERFELREPAVSATRRGGDGTVKYLFLLDDDESVEGVAMPEDSKVTFCLSSQAGCALGCTFCVTGALGSGRNLRPAEMVGQLRAMLRDQGEPERVNVVFMGMGEPLLNTDNLGPALEVLFETISPRRVTVSTAGIIPGIKWLATRARRPKLALSLNAPDQARRQLIMPVAHRYPLVDLMRELRGFPLEGGRRITFEYVLIAGFNDSAADARAVAALVRGIPSKINLIPLNEDPLLPAAPRRPDQTVVDRFVAILHDRGVTVTTRRSRGTDVAAACGQLKGRDRKISEI